MAQGSEINSYYDQIRYRIEQHEKKFRQTIDALFGQVGATGQTGKFYADSFRSLIESFDAQISEVVDYFLKVRGKISIADNDLLSATASELSQSAIGYKATINTERFRSVARLDRIPRMMHETFEELDRLLTLRMQDLKLQITPSQPLTTLAPASDRLVWISHNQFSTEILQAVEHLGNLSDAIEQSNEGDEVDREIALSEIAAFEKTLIQPRISSELIERFVDRIIAWMLRAFTGAMVANVAEKLVAALLELINSSAA